MFVSLTDQLNREVVLNKAPERIVSLVPSLTELLFDLELENKVVGITRFCVHPPSWKNNKTIVGGTKNLNRTKIKRLQPELVIANKEENKKSQVEQLIEDYPTWVTDVDTFSSALSMIKDIGVLTGSSAKAEEIAGKIEKEFKDLEKATVNLKVAYLIWKDPFMTVGGDTFINDMLNQCNFTNVFSNKERYPHTSLEELEKLDCDVVLLSTEPYPFNNLHLKEIQLALPKSKVILADGEYFSWYGSRMLHAPSYFERLIKQIELE